MTDDEMAAVDRGVCARPRPRDVEYLDTLRLNELAHLIWPLIP